MISVLGSGPLLWLGVVVFVSGGLVLRYATREPRRAPRWIARLGVAMGALGLGTMAMTQPGLGWAISSICFSLIAIIYLVAILIELLKR